MMTTLADLEALVSAIEAAPPSGPVVVADVAGSRTQQQRAAAARRRRRRRAADDEATDDDSSSSSSSSGGAREHHKHPKSPAKRVLLDLLRAIRRYGRQQEQEAPPPPPSSPGASLVPLLVRVLTSPLIRYDANYDIARCLIKHGGMSAAELNGPSCGPTPPPLHAAASSGVFELSWLLLRLGARPSLVLRDAAGRTPAEVAAQHEHIEVADYLLAEQGEYEGERGEEGQGEDGDGDGEPHHE
jgi:hypothetical protein